MKSAFERAGECCCLRWGGVGDGGVGGWGDFPVCDVRFINSAII